MHKEEQGVLRDSALERVSDRMRKAFTLNKSELGDLQSTVTRIKKERHRSFSSITKQQQLFLRKQSRIIPAARLQTITRKKSSSDSISQPVNVVDSGQNKKGMKAFPILPPIFHQKDDQDAFHAKDKTIVDDLEYQHELDTLNQSLNNVRLFLSRSLPEIADGTFEDDLEPQKLISSTVDLHPAMHLSDRLKKDENNLEIGLNYNSNSGKAVMNIKTDTKVKQDSENIILGAEKPQVYREGCHVRSRRVSSEKGQPLRRSPFTSNDIVHKKTARDDVFSRGTTVSKKQRKLSRVNSCDTIRTRASTLDSDAFTSCKSATEKNETGYGSQSALRRWSKLRKSLKYATLINKSDDVNYIEKLYREIRGCRYIRKHPKQELEDEARDEVESLGDGGLESTPHHRHCPCYVCEKSQLSSQ